MSDRDAEANDPRPKIISFVNFKGGVGKTSVAVNVAATMASEKFGKRVLLVDMDAQANASIWCMGRDRWRSEVAESRENTVFQIFMNAKDQRHYFDFNESVFCEGLLEGHAPNLSLLASTYKMMQAEEIVRQAQAVAKTRVLKTRLSDHVSRYDVVIFDCPPNTYYVTQNALSMSDFIFVPAIPDFLSMVGFRELVNRLKSLRQIVDLPDPIPVRGVIANSHNPKWNELRTGIGQLEFEIGELRKQGAVAADCELLTPPISRSIACSNAARRGLPLLACKTPGAIKMALEFEELTTNLFKILGI